MFEYGMGSIKKGHFKVALFENSFNSGATKQPLLLDYLLLGDLAIQVITINITIEVVVTTIVADLCYVRASNN